jgi:acyl-CoA dehydrogenase
VVPESIYRSTEGLSTHPGLFVAGGECLHGQVRRVGFAREFAVERKFRETRLYQTAPVSTNMILAYVSQQILKLLRSY